LGHEHAFGPSACRITFSSWGPKAWHPAIGLKLRFLDDIRRVNSGLDARVQAAGDEASQSGPVMGEEPVECGPVAASDHFQQAPGPCRIGVGIGHAGLP